MQRTSRLQTNRKEQLMVLMRILITILLLALCSCDLYTIIWGELLCSSGVNVHASADTDSLYVEIVAGDSLIYSKKDTSKYFSWGIDNRDLENFNWTINITSYRQPDSTNTETYQFFINFRRLRQQNLRRLPSVCSNTIRQFLRRLEDAKKYSVSLDHSPGQALAGMTMSEGCDSRDAPYTTAKLLRK